MSVVRSPVRSVVRSPVRGVFGASAQTPIQQILALSGSGQALSDAGLFPLHWLDFANDRAYWNGEDVGAITGVPNRTGTLNLSSAGHTLGASGNILTITTPAVDYPLTLWVEFKRTTDSGANQPVLQIDDGSTNNRALLQVNSSDLASGTITAGGVNQAFPSVAGATVVDTICGMAVRVAANNVNMARDGTLGTVDTSVTLPATPTRIVIGSNSFGDILRLGVFDTGLADADLQAATVFF